LNEITSKIKSIDFPDDTDNKKLLSFINNSNDKKIIFPFQLVGKDYNKLYNFYFNIIRQLLNTNLRNNTCYFFTNDPFYLNNKTEFCITFNNVLNLLYKNANENIKIISPLFSLTNVRFSDKNEPGHFPLLENYNNVVFFPYIHYCYKLSQTSFNSKPIQKILLSGAVASEGYPDRFKLQFLANKYPQYIDQHKLSTEQRDKETWSANNTYNVILNSYLVVFYSGVYNTDNNFILLKLYEILGSGALLLLEKKSQNICNSLGLIENKHYLTIDFNEDEFKVMYRIKNILNVNNANHILNVRREGMEFCHKNLNYNFTTKKFLDFVGKKICGYVYMDEEENELNELKLQISNEIKNGNSLELLNTKIVDDVYKSCHNQIHILYDIRNLLQKEKCIYVEIGAWLGDSASLLLNNDHKTDIYCIDSFHNNYIV
tara:strand:- start:6662 stop:7951 length:1290 start_codon:yes stop_codon:yes gene_type:complete